jgi:hypothetical protein
MNNLYMLKMAKPRASIGVIILYLNAFVWALIDGGIWIPIMFLSLVAYIMVWHDDLYRSLSARTKHKKILVYLHYVLHPINTLIVLYSYIDYNPYTGVYTIQGKQFSQKFFTALYDAVISDGEVYAKMYIKGGQFSDGENV